MTGIADDAGLAAMTARAARWIERMGRRPDVESVHVAWPYRQVDVVLVGGQVEHVSVESVVGES